MPPSQDDPGFARALAKILEVGVENLMDHDMRPRAVPEGRNNKQKARLQDPDTRILEPHEWTLAFITKLEELIESCPTEQLKAKLRKHMKYRRANRGLPTRLRHTRGLVNQDLNAAMSSLGKVVTVAGTKRGRADSPHEGVHSEALQLTDTDHKDDTDISKHVNKIYQRAIATIQRVGIDNLMRPQMRPRELTRCGSSRWEPKLHEPETRMLKITEWEFQFVLAFVELINALQDPENVKQRLNDHMERRQKDDSIHPFTRLVRGVILQDINTLLCEVRDESDAKVTAGEKQKRKRDESPRDDNGGSLHQQSQKKIRVEQEEEDIHVARSLQQQPQKIKTEPEEDSGNFASTTLPKAEHSDISLAEMLFKNLERLDKIKEAMGDSEEPVEGEAANFTEHFMASHFMGAATRELCNKSEQDFERACFDLDLLYTREQRARLAYKRVVIATWCRDLSKHLEKTIGLVLEDHVKQEFLSVIPPDGGES